MRITYCTGYGFNNHRCDRVVRRYGTGYTNGPTYFKHRPVTIKEYGAGWCNRRGAYYSGRCYVIIVYGRGNTYIERSTNNINDN